MLKESEYTCVACTLTNTFDPYEIGSATCEVCGELNQKEYDQIIKNRVERKARESMQKPMGPSSKRENYICNACFKLVPEGARYCNTQGCTGEKVKESMIKKPKASSGLASTERKKICNKCGVEMAPNMYMCMLSNCNGKAGYEKIEHFGINEEKIQFKKIASIYY